MNDTMIWHVVFHPGRDWGGRYRHVGLAGYSDDTWLNLDLQRRRVNVSTVYRHDEVQDYLSYLMTYYTVVRFGAPRPSRGYILRPMTCVSFAKHVLGFRSCALRPDGLLRDLLRDPDTQALNETTDPTGNPSTSRGATAG